MLTRYGYASLLFHGEEHLGETVQSLGAEVTKEFFLVPMPREASRRGKGVGEE